MMKSIKSISDKRIIIECDINDKKANFLIDTGASISLVDENAKNIYNLNIGQKYSGSIYGAGGKLCNARYCDTPIKLMGKSMTKFIAINLKAVADTIEKESDIRIVGIIGLPQMKMLGIQIDTKNNSILL